MLGRKWLRTASGPIFVVRIMHNRNNQMAADWYYAIDSNKKGPVTEVELRRLVASGTLKRTDLVWQERLPSWIKAEEVEGLFLSIPLRLQPQSPRYSPKPKKRLNGLVVAGSLFVAALLFCSVALFVATQKQPQRNEPRVPENRQLAVNKIEAPVGVPAKADRNENSQLVDRNQVLGDIPAEKNGESVPDVPKPSDMDNQPVATAEPVWRIFQHPKGPVEVEMPAEAVLAKDLRIVPAPPGVISLIGGPLPGTNLDIPTNYTANAGDFSCSLQVSRLAPFVVSQIAAKPSDYGDQFKYLSDFVCDDLESQGGPKAKLILERPVQLGTAQGRELQIETPQHLVVARWYMTRTHQFWASIVLPKTRSTTAERDHFFKSLRLITEAPKPVPKVTQRGALPSFLTSGATKATQEVSSGEKTNIDAIREYFERAETIRLSRLKSLEESIAELRFAVMNAAAGLKVQKQRELAIAEKAHAELKTLQPFNPPLPLPYAVGDIGFQETLSGVSIWNDTTVTATVNSISIRYDKTVSAGAIRAIVKGVDTKSIAKLKPDRNNQRTWPSKLFLRVIATSPDEETLKQFPEGRRQSMRDCVVLEPFPKTSDIEDFRERFYSHKSGEKAGTP